MYNVVAFNDQVAYGLEMSEAIYWNKYYTSKGLLKNFSQRFCGAYAVAIPELDILAMNRVIGLGMQDKVQPYNIDEIISFYRHAGVKRFFIQLSPYTKQYNLPEILLDKGFRLHNHWSKLMRLADNPIELHPTTLTVKKIGPEDAPVFGEILFKCFDWEDTRLIHWLGSVVGKDGYLHYLAMHQQTPVAAAALHCNGSFGSMAFAGTLKEYRGMGAQGLLLRTRIADAVVAGCKYVVAETAEPGPFKPVASHRNMLKAGFEDIYRRENWLMEL